MSSNRNRKSNKLTRSQVQKQQAKARASEEAKQQKKDRQTLMYKVMAVVFAVLMALGVALPSLSSVVGGDDTGQSISSIEDVDGMYAASVKQLEDTLASNPDDPDTLQNLGSMYASWGQMASYFASTSEDGEAHVQELYAKSISYYDTYLEKNESADAVVNRARVRALTDDVATAKAELEQLVQTVTDNANAWLLLGSIYETEGSTDAARDAYQKAIDADPDDAAGAKSSAEARINAIDNPDAGTAEGTTAEDGTAAASGETGPEALSDALNEAAGTGVN